MLHYCDWRDRGGGGSDGGGDGNGDDSGDDMAAPCEWLPWEQPRGSSHSRLRPELGR